MRWIAIIKEIYFSPSKSYEKINKGVNWVGLFSLIGIIFYFLLTVKHIIEINLLKRVYNPLMISKLFDNTVSISVIKILIPPITIILKALFVCTIMWLLLTLFYERKVFIRIFTLNIFGFYILALGVILNIIILFLKANSPILSRSDYTIYFGLNMFLKTTNTFFSNLFSEINVISVWWLFFMINGLSYLANIKIRISSVIVIASFVFWITVEYGILKVFIRIFSQF